MKLTAPVYCCTECKKIVKNLPELLFVEENSNKGFCSEECIEFFYSPMLKFYEEVLHNLKTEYDLHKEVVFFDLSEHDLVEDVIASPSEIWRSKNELLEEIYVYLRHYNHASVIVLCTVFNSEPSFIFLSAKTCSQKLISDFRIGERLIIESDTRVDEIITDLESKKSFLIAELLGRRLDSDIPFEEFPAYEFCFGDTMESPDEVFEWKDREGDLLLINIKSFTRNDVNVFYIIISLSSMTILAFPTKDINLYAEYRVGKKISSNFKN